MSDIDAALTRLGEAIGIPELRFDADGLCSLEIDGLGVDIQRSATESRLLLTALAGQLPADDRAGAMERLLDANCLFRGTGGATIGVPSGTTAVVLARQIPLVETREHGALADMLHAFVGAAASAAALLDSATSGSGAPIDLNPGMIRV